MRESCAAGVVESELGLLYYNPVISNLDYQVKVVQESPMISKWLVVVMLFSAVYLQLASRMVTVHSAE